MSDSYQLVILYAILFFSVFHWAPTTKPFLKTMTEFFFWGGLKDNVAPVKTISAITINRIFCLGGVCYFGLMGVKI